MPEKVSAAGFCNFCKNNIPLLIAVSLTLFFTYGIRLLWYSAGIDTTVFIAFRARELEWGLRIGRFGFVFLSNILHIRGFNPFTAFFMAFCLFWFAAISWAYILAVFSKDTGRNNKLIPFALLFMTMPVWATQFYFLQQAAENALIIALCPYIIYLLYKGFLDNEKGKVICGFALFVFSVSVYQAIIPLFICGVFACFLFLQENSNYKPKVYRNLCLKLFLTLIGVIAVYLFIDRIIIPPVFNIERASYLDNMFRWGQAPFMRIITQLLFFGYVLIGPIPPIHNIATRNIANIVGTDLETISWPARIYGNVLLLPATVLFLIAVIVIMRRAIPKERRFLYLLAGIGVPFSIILMALAGGNVPPMRALYSLPFASAFMLYFLIKTSKKKIAIVISCIALLAAGYQAQISAQLFYSDQLRYNEDVRLANNFYNLINSVQTGDIMLPVALVGRRDTSSQFQVNFIHGEMIGSSVFAQETASSTTLLGLSFMRNLGMNFEAANPEQIRLASQWAAWLPAYPDPGCVMIAGDFILVRISETLN